MRRVKMRILRLSVGPTQVAFSELKGERFWRRNDDALSRGCLAEGTLKTFEPQVAAVDLLLWAPFVDSQVISTKGLSWWDHFCLKRQLRRQHPAFVVNPGVCLSGKPFESQQLVLTTASLSELSQQVVKRVESWGLPLRSFRIRTVSVPKTLLRQKMGNCPWRGCLFRLERNLFFSLAFVGHGRRPILLLTRSLPVSADNAGSNLDRAGGGGQDVSSSLIREIVQSVDYVSRKVGQSIRQIDLLVTTECPFLKETDFSTSLAVALTSVEQEEETATSEVNLLQASLQRLRGEYRIGQLFKAAACVFGVVSGGVSLSYQMATLQEHRRQQALCAEISYRGQPEEEFRRQQELRQQLAFLAVKSQQSWPEDHSFELLSRLLSTVQKQGNLISLTGGTARKEAFTSSQQRGALLALAVCAKPQKTQLGLGARGGKAGLAHFQQGLTRSLKRELSKSAQAPFSLVSFVDSKEGTVTVRTTWGQAPATRRARPSSRKTKATSISCLLKSYGGNYVHAN